LSTKKTILTHFLPKCSILANIHLITRPLSALQQSSSSKLSLEAS